MSENSNNSNDSSNNKPRFNIPSAYKVYESTSTSINTSFLKSTKTFSNVPNEGEGQTNTQIKNRLSNVTKESEVQTNIQTLTETSSSMCAVKRFSNVGTITQTNSNILSTTNLPSAPPTYQSSNKHTSLPKIAEPTAGKFGPGGSIQVNPCQRGNPVLSNIRTVAWEYKDILPDYVVGHTTCVLYLSLKYHKLYPDYIYQRAKKLGSSYKLRIILCRVDISDPDRYLQELTKLGLNANYTLFLAWNDEEGGQYLENFKSLENQPPNSLKEKPDTDPLSQFSDALTKVRGVNKTDVLTLASNFGSFKNLLEANVNNLSLCPGFGLVKAQRLKNALDSPFKRSKTD